jgi:6-phosphogluconolactonase (cycloisomerase 2 family)
LGVGLTTAAVAAAGTYFLYGSKNSTKNRKMVKSWMLKAKAEVLEQLEDAKEMTQEEYLELINNVAGAYAGLKTASQVDIREFKSEMKDHWDVIEDMAASRKKAAKKTVKKATKAVKKTAKKAPKKTANKPVKKTAKKTTKK